MLTKQLRLLERVAVLYAATTALLHRENLADIELDGWKALDVFFSYAYERQGASPAYAPAARKTVRVLVSQGASWEEHDLSQRAWWLYCEQLGGRLPNEKNNPMCPRGTPYETKRGGRKTQQRGVIEFVQEELSGADYSIVQWARRQLETGEVRPAHKDLKGISGVGGKIASFFLRDVAWVYGIEPDLSRELLQPIDVWVRRYVHHWTRDDRLSDKGCGHWIVEYCLKAGVSPEKINVGMWYFGARVARDERTLRRLLDDVEEMQVEIDNHVKRMASRVAAWRATKDVYRGYDNCRKG